MGEINLMREISFKTVKEAVKEAYIRACIELPQDIVEALDLALEREENTLAKKTLEILIENQKIAQREKLPLCQDTGIPVVFLRYSEGYYRDWIEEAVHRGIEEAVREGYLRASVAHPLKRTNTGTNTPAIIHHRPQKETGLEIWLMPKGCGSENMSRLAMLSPAQGIEGIKAFVIETVKKAGPNPCPPIIVGVGIGGDFEKCALLAKEALFRGANAPHPEEEVKKLEIELLEEINRLGIGPLGFGGKTTALAVNIEIFPCHIASLPVAVNLQCHSARTVKIKFS